MDYLITKYNIDNFPVFQADLDRRSNRKECEMILELMNRYAHAVIDYELDYDRWHMGRRSELIDLLVELYGVYDGAINEVVEYAKHFAAEIKEAQA